MLNSKFQIYILDHAMIIHGYIIVLVGTYGPHYYKHTLILRYNNDKVNNQQTLPSKEEYNCNTCYNLLEGWHSFPLLLCPEQPSHFQCQEQMSLHQDEGRTLESQRRAVIR